MAESDAKKRLSRKELDQLLAPLDAEGLRRMLRELYARGSADLRRRIEAVAVPRSERPPKAGTPPVDGVAHARTVQEFVALARSGAYMGGDRRVSRNERSRWRVPFRALLDDSGSLLSQGDVGNGGDAVTALLDLALDCRDFYYFRSQDVVSALRLVVSDVVDLLWRTSRETLGFPALVARSPRDLLRWESAHGWTRMGYGTVAPKERPLAQVLAALLPSHDAWVSMAGAWLDIFAAAHGRRPAVERSSGRRPEPTYVPSTPATWAVWHELLYSRLRGTDEAPLLERLAAVPERPGWDLWLLRIRLARDAGREDEMRRLCRAALADFPGSPELAAVASEAGASGRRGSPG